MTTPTRTPAEIIASVFALTDDPPGPVELAWPREILRALAASGYAVVQLHPDATIPAEALAAAAEALGVEASNVTHSWSVVVKVAVAAAAPYITAQARAQQHRCDNCDGIDPASCLNATPAERPATAPELGALRDLIAQAIQAEWNGHAVVCEHTQLIPFGALADTVMDTLRTHASIPLRCQELNHEARLTNAEERLAATAALCLGQPAREAARIRAARADGPARPNLDDATPSGRCRHDVEHGPCDGDSVECTTDAARGQIELAQQQRRRWYAEALAAKFTEPTSRYDRMTDTETVEGATPAERVDRQMRVRFLAGDGHPSFTGVTCTEAAEVCAAVRDDALAELRAQAAFEKHRGDTFAGDLQFLELQHRGWKALAEQAEATLKGTTHERDLLRAALARVIALAKDMRDWCSPYGVVRAYSDRIAEAVLGAPYPHRPGEAIAKLEGDLAAALQGSADDWRQEAADTSDRLVRAYELLAEILAVFPPINGRFSIPVTYSASVAGNDLERWRTEHLKLLAASNRTPEGGRS
ncbi:hypothetical protein DQ384_05090 [Sphaerisporangium album]|uniref:Uncharacterized protein n=1 Tax=Sphaerisporangium album TaxID=509200 RepID=A0A367FNT3_9ACTN|nr:hypothetical protein [Sphaerisporangium album]RCG31921.1 hypothetical protein DQ384_05090 [Sphaerisporangium album]